MSVTPTDSILIVDFGSQVTQLIARRVREAGVYSEIAPFNAADAAFDRLQPKGIILSGGPASVTEATSPRAPQRFFEAGIPILGICYGQQTMCQQLGGEVIVSGEGEFGRAFVEVTARSHLFDGLWAIGERHQVWMSHGDKVTRLPEGFAPIAVSEGAPFVASTASSSTPKSSTPPMARS
jgi:GMP synthase (glutamine-hydrolysing)